MFPSEQKRVEIMKNTTACGTDADAMRLSTEHYSFTKPRSLRFGRAAETASNSDNFNDMSIDTSKEALHHSSETLCIQNDGSKTPENKDAEMRDPLVDAFERFVLYLDDARDNVVSSVTPASQYSMHDSIQQLGDCIFQDAAMFESASNLYDGICDGAPIKFTPVWLSNSDEENVLNKENQYVHRESFGDLNHSSSIMTTETSGHGLHLSPAFSDDENEANLALDSCNSFYDFGKQEMVDT